MKLLKKIISFMSAVLVIALLVFTICMQLYPKETSSIVGFRFYTVLTNSMEPVIPTYSLVFSKIIDEKETIDPNTIVTFQANRFGQDILLTHYFRKTQVGEDGNTYYRTQGATAPNYDNYETKRSDIIGKYIFHIPYLGKIILFLQSKFGFVMYAELFVIWLINKTIKTRWVEKDEEKKARRANRRRPFALTELMMEHQGEYVLVSGVLLHHMKKPVRFVTAKLTFYDEHHKVIREDKWYLSGKEYLAAEEKKEFTYTLADAKEIKDFEIHIIKYKH